MELCIKILKLTFLSLSILKQICLRGSVWPSSRLHSCPLSRHIAGHWPLQILASPFQSVCICRFVLFWLLRRGSEPDCCFQENQSRTSPWSPCITPSQHPSCHHTHTSWLRESPRSCLPSLEVRPPEGAALLESCHRGSCNLLFSAFSPLGGSHDYWSSRLRDSREELSLHDQ